MAAVSPQIDVTSIAIAIVVPTYKRPEHLVLTLESLQAQTTEAAFAVVVVENHAAGREGAVAASRVLSEGGLAGVVVVEPRQGNCNAYNAGFATALDTFPNLTHVAIIDDDEVASPTWLSRLLAGAAEGGADIVGGPQVPRFEDAVGARRYGGHPVVQPAHASTGAAGLITSTGNCLVGVQVLHRMRPRFLDERFNFLGGGDTDF
ncbi:MAG: glycosyltransferase family 2 protein, partial [Beijerinckiaceae bacterium]